MHLEQDVAFVQTHVVRRLDLLGLVDADDFRVVGQQTHVINGVPFPIEVSTDVR
jgi:hypothetical protein